jgi:large subunit ribosomal protein L25
MFTIKAKKRDEGIKLDFLRKSGEIPAVFYGAGKDTTSILVPIVEFKKVWRDAGESSAIVVEMLDKNIDVLIHEVQVDPVSGEPMHVDFLAIDMKKKIRVHVPLKFEGISEAVKNGIGNLVKVMYEFEIEALPSDLPQNLVVDISKLKTLDDQIFVSDVKLPSGVIAINEPTEVVVSVVEQVEEKEEVAAPVDLSAIEVEKKGKKDLEAPEAGEVAPETVSSKK